MHLSLSIPALATIIGAIVYAATDRKPACLLGLATYVAGLTALLIGLR
jgi:hypothetical protein